MFWRSKTRSYDEFQEIMSCFEQQLKVNAEMQRYCNEFNDVVSSLNKRIRHLEKLFDVEPNKKDLIV